MDRRHAAGSFLRFVLLFPLASALPQQPTSSTNSDPSGTPTDSSAVETSSNSSDGPIPLDPNYYYVSIALILCVVGLAAFFFWRRKKQLASTIRHSRESALRRDVDSWDPLRSRRRYWNGRYRADHTGHEEGLNDQGEAPPPYVPKSQNDESGAHNNGSGPAIPLQTLSREDAGLKPPDYTLSDVRSADNWRPSTASVDSTLRPT